LNRETIPSLPALSTRLHEVFSIRTERILLLRAEEDLPFQQIADVVSLAQEHVDFIALVPRGFDFGAGSCLAVRPPRMWDYHYQKPPEYFKEVPIWHIW